VSRDRHGPYDADNPVVATLLVTRVTDQLGRYLRARAGERRQCSAPWLVMVMVVEMPAATPAATASATVLTMSLLGLGLAEVEQWALMIWFCPRFSAANVSQAVVAVAEVLRALLVVSHQASW